MGLNDLVVYIQIIMRSGSERNDLVTYETDKLWGDKLSDLEIVVEICDCTSL